MVHYMKEQLRKVDRNGEGLLMIYATLGQVRSFEVSPKVHDMCILPTQNPLHLPTPHLFTTFANCVMS